MKLNKLNLLNNLVGINLIPILIWNLSISLLLIIFQTVDTIRYNILNADSIITLCIIPILLCILNVRYINKNKLKYIFPNIILMIIGIIIGDIFDFYIYLHFLLMDESVKDYIVPRNEHILNVLLIALIGFFEQIVLLIRISEKKNKDKYRDKDKMEEDWWWK